MIENTEIETLVSEYLDLWQENIRLWSVDKEHLTPQDLDALLSPAYEDREE